MDRPSDHGGGDGEALMRAAEYVRISTEHQKYSTENQAEAIAADLLLKNWTVLN